MSTNDAEHLRERAAAVRRAAENFKDAESRRLLLGIAEDHERSARTTEQQARAAKSGSGDPPR